MESPSSTSAFRHTHVPRHRLLREGDPPTRQGARPSRRNLGVNFIGGFSASEKGCRGRQRLLEAIPEPAPRHGSRLRQRGITRGHQHGRCALLGDSSRKRDPTANGAIGCAKLVVSATPRDNPFMPRLSGTVSGKVINVVSASGRGPQPVRSNPQAPLACWGRDQTHAFKSPRMGELVGARRHSAGRPLRHRDLSRSHRAWATPWGDPLSHGSNGVRHPGTTAAWALERRVKKGGPWHLLLGGLPSFHSVMWTRIIRRRRGRSHWTNWRP
jgi:hypothetical protein